MDSSSVWIQLLLSSSASPWNDDTKQICKIAKKSTLPQETNAGTPPQLRLQQMEWRLASLYVSIETEWWSRSVARLQPRQLEQLKWKCSTWPICLKPERLLQLNTCLIYSLPKDTKILGKTGENYQIKIKICENTRKPINRYPEIKYWI